jgi:DNA-binding HxlR family transcriptional regulator
MMAMPDVALKPDRLAVLRLVHEFGSSVCVGTCEHRKPGELHCHNIGQAVKISSAGAKRRLFELVELGLLVRERVEREDGKVVGRYTVSPQGLELLKHAG